MYIHTVCIRMCELGTENYDDNKQRIAQNEPIMSHSECLNVYLGSVYNIMKTQVLF